MNSRFACCAGSVACLMALDFASMAHGQDEKPKSDLTAQQQLVAGNNAFAFDLYAKLTAKNDDNLVCSPYSISFALAMTYGGAAGTTAKEMEKTLHFSLPSAEVHQAFAGLLARHRAVFLPKFYELNLANALWVQKGFGLNAAFVDLTREKYDAPLQELDFSAAPEPARKVINQWVLERTKGKIADLLKPEDLSPPPSLVLTNAIFLKGIWFRPFPEYATYKTDFRVSATKKVAVSMMRRDEGFRYLEDGDMQLLDLPLGKGGVSLLIALPKKVDGLADLEKSLTSERLEKLRKEMAEREVDVHLPKFKIETRVDLSEQLKALGMRSAFGAGADFSGIAKAPLFIGKVVHKAFLDVNEKGLEAAAATAVITTKSGPPKTVFRADHPFLYVIRDNSSGSILFMGRLTNPT